MQLGPHLCLILENLVENLMYVTQSPSLRDFSSLYDLKGRLSLGRGFKTLCCPFKR